MEQAGKGMEKAQLKSATHLHPPSISQAPQRPTVGWEQYVPSRRTRPVPRVISTRPR